MRTRLSKRAFSVLVVGAVLAGGGVYGYGNRHPSGPSLTPDFYVAASGGSNSNACTTSGAACATLDGALGKASCGKLIEMLNGSHTRQDVSDKAYLDSCTGNPVTVTGQSKAGTVVEWIGNCDGSCGSSNGLHNVTIETLTLTWGIAIEDGSTNITVDNVDGGSFAIGGSGDGASGNTQNITIENSDWGPCDADAFTFGGASDCRNWITLDSKQGQNRIETGANGVTIYNNVIHNFTRDDPANTSTHFECVWSNGGYNVTWDRNTFYHCWTNGVSLGNGGSGGSGQEGTWVFENNICSDSNNTGCFKFGIATGGAVGNLFIFKFNSFGSGNGITNEDNGAWTPAAGHIYIIGNIIGFANDSGAGINCITNATYTDNLWLNSGGGTGCESGSGQIGALPYVNTASLESGGDYHLSGAAGSTTADNYVPTSVTNSTLDHDKDGNARPHNTNYDAGAYER